MEVRLQKGGCPVVGLQRYADSRQGQILLTSEAAQGKKAVESRHRLMPVAEPMMDLDPGQPCDSARGVQFQGLRQRVRCVKEPPHSAQGPPQSKVRVCISLVKVDGPSVGSLALLHPMLNIEGIAQHAEGCCRCDPSSRGLLQRRLGLGHLTQLQKGEGQVGVKALLIGIALDGMLVCLDGFCRPSLTVIALAEVVPDSRLRGIVIHSQQTDPWSDSALGTLHAQKLLQARHGVVQLAAGRVQHPQIEDDVEIVWELVEGSQAHRLCLFIARHLGEGHHHV